MQSPSAVLLLPPQLANISIISHVWQVSSPEACITVDAFSLIFQTTFRPRCDRTRCCGCFCLRKGVTCSEEQKYPWEIMKPLSLIPISQPWPYSKSCSHLLQSTLSAQGQETCTSWKNIFCVCNGCSIPTALLSTYEKWSFCVCTYGKILSTLHALLWKQKLTCMV